MDHAVYQTDCNTRESPTINRHTSEEKAGASRTKPLADRVSLTRQEQEIIRLVAMGSSSSVIAMRLDVSDATVTAFMQRLFEKLGVTDRSSAVLRALSLGYITQ